MISRTCFPLLVVWAAAACLSTAVAAEKPSPSQKSSISQTGKAAEREIELWSLRPVTHPEIPAVSDTRWPRTDVDRFILARLEQAKLQPNPDAGRHALLRRVAFDLTGLPPTEDEIRKFVGDRASDDAALAKVVDGYLASPRFGERWGRHWLDVVRYADNVGRTWNAPFTYAWRYRNYVIDSFNKDTPYDRFILEQLAGDLLPHRSVDEQRNNLLGTGFLALGSLDIQNGQFEAAVMDCLDEQIDVTTRAFLGLTVSCARCHDHKYDPVTMRDYYALAGIFYSTRTMPGTGRVGELGPNMYVDPDRLIALPVSAGDRPTDKITLRGIHSMSDYQAVWSRGERDIRFDTHPDLAMGAVEGSARDCEIRRKGEAYDRDYAPPRGDMQIAGFGQLPVIPENASGRLQLAQWMTAPDHPLTARVMVNRVWQHLFGKGLVRTVDEFGNSGESPTHPELLDHLAGGFIQQGWSVKQFIRSLVLSRTYRLSSAGSQKNEQVDAQNQLHWRMDLRRLELEPLRDSMLSAAGRLSFDRPETIQLAGIGGKSKQSEVRSLQSLDSSYRTVYLPVLRSLLPEMYKTFDFPDPAQIVGERHVTTVATQALFLMNSDFAVRCATSTADRIRKDVPANSSDRIRLAYLRLLGREPDAAELRDATEFARLLRPGSAERDPELYVLTAFVQALMASAEFRYVR